MAWRFFSIHLPLQNQALLLRHRSSSHRRGGSGLDIRLDESAVAESPARITATGGGAR